MSYAARDDGEVRAGVPWLYQRFLDNGDGTLTDSLTGLVWLQDASCFAAEQWQGALDTVVDFNDGDEFACTNYTAGTYDDWRLPNIGELESLTHPVVGVQTTWLHGQGFLTVVASPYYSSTTYSAITTWAWIVDLSGGYSGSKLKTDFTYLWPVRGTSSSPAQLWRSGQTTSYDANLTKRDDGGLEEGAAWPVTRFTDLTGGVYRDELTGLEWLEDANCIATQYPEFDNDGTEDGEVTWQHALDFVAGINDGTYANCGGGHDDWRLANRKELISLTDYSQDEPGLPAGHPFDNVQEDRYWSSTTDYDVAGLRWYVDMWRGGWHWDSDTNENFVWPVRAGAGLDDIFLDGFESGDSCAWSNSGC